MISGQQDFFFFFFFRYLVSRICLPFCYAGYFWCIVTIFSFIQKGVVQDFFPVPFIIVQVVLFFRQEIFLLQLHYGRAIVVK